jgi:hypothetical protein
MASMNGRDRDEIDQLKRDADLLDFACHRAGFAIDWKESSPRGNPTHWILRRPTDDAKILVLRSRNCWLYFDLRQHGQELGSGRLSPGGGHGTIIDFVQQELGLPRGRGLPSVGLALKEIRNFMGIVPPRKSRKFSQSGDANDKPRGPAPEVLQRWNAAREASSSGYLASRGLTEATMSHERFKGGWRLDGRDNVLFAHRDGDGRLVGFEIKNHGFTSYPHGGVRTGMWRSNPTTRDMYYLVTESAINALSFQQLHPEMPTAHRSFGGRIGTAQLRLLASELDRLPRKATVLLAFDGAGDPAGRQYEEDVRRLLPKDLRAETAHPPHGKDWNDYLQSLELGR